MCGIQKTPCGIGLRSFFKDAIDSVGGFVHRSS